MRTVTATQLSVIVHLECGCSVCVAGTETGPERHELVNGPRHCPCGKYSVGLGLIVKAWPRFGERPA